MTQWDVHIYGEFLILFIGVVTVTVTVWCCGCGCCWYGREAVDIDLLWMKGEGQDFDWHSQILSQNFNWSSQISSQINAGSCSIL